ncbi:high-affinity branched-chain amino acid transport ATP-binding protein LIVG [Brucella ceti TE28753-12]|nr:high-affinity branched-chain amino acid transport ATP-binding protein LIVG [Brucella ceti TE28753-12]
MTKDILVLDQLNKSFGPAHIIRGVNLAVRDGERHAVIGRMVPVNPRCST